MTPAQWSDVERALCSPYASARLKCDAYEISLSIRRLKGLRLAIVLFVGGEFKGRWLTEDCEERRRFFCPMQIRPGKGELAWHKSFCRLERALGKKPAPAPEPVTYYRWHWTSFKRLKAHLGRHNQVIDLVSVSSF